MSKIAVVLSGCGVYDGSEIYETTLTLLALSQKGQEVQCFAPDRKQYHVIDHRNGEAIASDTRSVLAESARLARGEIEPLSTLDVNDFDALVFPGGFGAAKNLCDFAIKGKQCQVHSEVEHSITEFYERGKPIGFLCIAPVLAAKVLGNKGISLTIGNDEETASAIVSFGAKHIEKKVGEVQVDRDHKIVSSPAYMLGQNIAEVHDGIQNFIAELLELV